jgi:hypothetical protein
LGLLFPIYGKIKNGQNHPPEMLNLSRFGMRWQMASQIRSINLVVDKWLVNPKNKPSPIGVHYWVILGITVPKMTPDMVACWDGCFLGLPHQFNYKW